MIYLIEIKIYWNINILIKLTPFLDLYFYKIFNNYKILVIIYVY